MALKGSSYLVLALIIGLVGVLAIHRAIQSKNQTVQEGTNPVVVADADIPSGSALNPKLVRVANWPKEIVHPQAATTVQQVDNRVATVPLFKGEPILLTKLAPEGTAAGLGGLLKSESQAFTIKVDDVSGVAGFLHPGARVDVLMILPTLKNTNEHLSKVILQDIKVLTAGQIWEQTNTNKPAPVNTVTLEVTPQQAEILNLASTQGKIRLTLRSSANKKVTPTTGITTSFFFEGQKKPEAPSNGSPAAKTPERSVEVIKRTKREEIKLQ
jgi:pilus assembly protein CpaB